MPKGLGVATHFTDPSPGEMQRLAEAGYRMIRTDLGWGGIERQPGRYDFAAYDRLMAHLKRAGVRPMFILDYGNRLYDHGQSPRSEAARAAFARFATAAASHFRGQGVVWEIWNEPNIQQFWKPQPDAQAYARLAIETARAVRAADPDAVILAPGSSELPWTFLETIFAAGLLEHIDAVSVHPYRDRPPETVLADYGRLRILIARHASPARRMLPIVSSEWGYTTADAAISEARQAEYLARQWLTNLAAGVNTSIFYDWRDDGDNPKEREHRFGTVRRNLEPKPSFLAARTLIQTLQGYTFRHRLEGATAADWRLLFQKVDQPDALVVVEWSADPRSDPSRQTPRYRRVGGNDPDAVQLRHLADIHITPGPLLVSQENPLKLKLVVINPESDRALLRMKSEILESPGRSPLNMPLSPGPNTIDILMPEPLARRLDRQQIRMSFTWNDVALPAIAPLDVYHIDPLAITAAPRGENLEVALENPGRGAFTGELVVRTGNLRVDGVAAHLAKGQDHALVQLPLPAGLHQLVLLDDKGRTAVETPLSRYQPMGGFPAPPESSTEMHAILFVDNAPRPPQPLKLTSSGADGPSPFALDVSYKFDAGWRYLSVAPSHPLAIPDEAQAAILWVRGNDSGDFLRCRFHDTSGQTFQPDLGRLDWSGWRPLRIELGSRSTASHWGGANDGTVHRPLTWEALLLIDSAQRPFIDPIDSGGLALLRVESMKPQEGK